MRYFKMVEDYKPAPVITIWVVREDGMEKCIHDPTNNYVDVSQHVEDRVGSWEHWQKPEDMGETVMGDMVKKDSGITEITKDEAFLEII